MKQGDKIRILQMEDHNGIDTQATRMNGNTYIVDYIDDAGQIHLKGSGLAIIPKVDKYVVIEVGKGDDSIRDYDREIMAIYDVVTDYIRLNDFCDLSLILLFVGTYSCKNYYFLHCRMLLTVS